MRKRDVPADVAEILGRSTIDGHRLKLPGQLARETYLRVNKVLAGLEGKWDRKAQAHVFPYDPAELLAKAVDQGEFSDRKQELQLFETPLALATRICALAGLGHPPHGNGLGKRVLEPSAGRGRLVHCALWSGADVTAVEIDERNYNHLLEADFPTGGRLHCYHADFLLWAAMRPDMPNFHYDAVVMNPPFRSNEDIRHVQAAWPLLKPGGTLVSVMSAHAFQAQDSRPRQFRSWLAGHGGTFTELSAGTFKESGTSVVTYLIELRKPEARAQATAPRPDLPLFTAETA